MANLISTRVQSFLGCEKMGLFDFRRGKILLTFYDIVTSDVIKEPLQVEVQKEGRLFASRVAKDGKFAMDNLPRIEDGFWLEYTEYYTYTLEITSTRYKKKRITCEFDKHVKEFKLDIALEPNETDFTTRIY